MLTFIKQKSSKQEELEDKVGSKTEVNLSVLLGGRCWLLANKANLYDANPTINHMTFRKSWPLSAVASHRPTSRLFMTESKIKP